MSEEIHGAPLFVTRFVGPASEGDDRARWQFTIPLSGEYATLRRDEVFALVDALIKSASEIKRAA